jgi:antitoxin VapB
MQAKTKITTAKLFQNGQSQAVRLPKEYRFEGTEVRIRRHGSSVILEPVIKGWEWLDTLRPLDEDVVEAIREGRKRTSQERPALNKLFK